MPEDREVLTHSDAKSHSSGVPCGCVTLQAVRTFTLPPAAAAAHVSAIHKLSAACEDSSWAPALLTHCERHLGNYVDAASKGTLLGDAAKAEWQACTAAFTAGEVSMRTQKAHVPSTLRCNPA